MAPATGGGLHLYYHVYLYLYLYLYWDRWLPTYHKGELYLYYHLYVYLSLSLHWDRWWTTCNRARFTSTHQHTRAHTCSRITSTFTSFQMVKYVQHSAQQGRIDPPPLWTERPILVVAGGVDTVVDIEANWRAAQLYRYT